MQMIHQSLCNGPMDLNVIDSNNNSVIFNVLLAVSDHEGGLSCAGLAEVSACPLSI